MGEVRHGPPGVHALGRAWPACRGMPLGAGRERLPTPGLRGGRRRRHGRRRRADDLGEVGARGGRWGRELLCKMAFLDPDSISVAVFEDFQLLLPALEEHGLVQVQRGPPVLVSIHALTQQVIRERLMGDARSPALRAVVAALQAQMDTFDKDKAETYHVCTCWAYTAHVRAALEHAGDTDASEDAARLAVAAGSFLQQVTSAYAEARLVYERALAIRQGAGESRGLAQCYMRIGNVCYSQGRYEEALVIHQKALEVFLAVYGQEHRT